MSTSTSDVAKKGTTDSQVSLNKAMGRKIGKKRKGQSPQRQYSNEEMVKRIAQFTELSAPTLYGDADSEPSHMAQKRKRRSEAYNRNKPSSISSESFGSNLKPVQVMVGNDGPVVQADGDCSSSGAVDNARTADASV